MTFNMTANTKETLTVLGVVIAIVAVAVAIAVLITNKMERDGVSPGRALARMQLHVQEEENKEAKVAKQLWQPSPIISAALDQTTVTNTPMTTNKEQAYNLVKMAINTCGCSSYLKFRKLNPAEDYTFLKLNLLFDTSNDYWAFTQELNRRGIDIEYNYMVYYDFTIGDIVVIIKEQIKDKGLRFTLGEYVFDINSNVAYQIIALPLKGSSTYTLENIISKIRVYKEEYNLFTGGLATMTLIQTLTDKVQQLEETIRKNNVSEDRLKLRRIKELVE